MGKTFKALKEKEKKEIELIEQQKRDNKILELSSFEVMCLFFISLFTNFSLLALFLSPIFPTKVLSNYKLLSFSFIVSAIFVTLSYRNLATKLINYYMKTRFVYIFSILTTTILSLHNTKIVENLKKVLRQYWESPMMSAMSSSARVFTKSPFTLLFLPSTAYIW